MVSGKSYEDDLGGTPISGNRFMDRSLIVLMVTTDMWRLTEVFMSWFVDIDTSYGVQPWWLIAWWDDSGSIILWDLGGSQNPIDLNIIGTWTKGTSSDFSESPRDPWRQATKNLHQLAKNYQISGFHLVEIEVVTRVLGIPADSWKLEVVMWEHGNNEL